MHSEDRLAEEMEINERLEAINAELLEALIEMRVALEDPSALTTLQLITIVAKADGAIAKARGNEGGE